MICPRFSFSVPLVKKYLDEFLSDKLEKGTMVSMLGVRVPWTATVEDLVVGTGIAQSSSINSANSRSSSSVNNPSLAS